MILDEILLHNFGVYLGRQTLQLTPPSKNKPVVLFGGLNGTGKTTLLDALQLALFGKLAKCSNRGSVAYDEFLKRCVHRSVDPKEGAAVEIQFRHISDGTEHTYRVHRSWSLNGTNMREHFEVLCDGHQDRVMTQSWDEHVERFIPIRISRLFFFDGEKIENLADLSGSSELLSTGIHSLLGLDLVDRLMTDLVVLERRKRASLKNDVEQEQIELAKAELSQWEQLREDLVSQQGAARNDLDRHKRYLEDLEDRFRLEGGKLLESREAIEADRAEAERRLRDVEDELREIASGAAPLLLVQILLSDIDVQDRREETAVRADTLGRILAERDAAILDEIKGCRAPDKLLSLIEDFLSNDRRKRRADAKTVRYLDLDSKARTDLQSLQHAKLSEIADQISYLIEMVEELQTGLVDIDRTLAKIPDEEALADLMKKRDDARFALKKAQTHFDTLNRELERVRRECDQKHSRLVKEIEQTVNWEFEQEGVIRTITHSQRVRKTLKLFRTSVVERHVKRIQHLVLDSFRQLLRKESLVSDLTINPKDFVLELVGPDGRLLSPDLLSAGERQLLAVSMLWGLARASGCPLPAIIDTPLGRLDAAHRTHLVERYFPFASHQVLLLSTDEEINEKYYQKLKGKVGRSYRLHFDDALDATQVQRGYFW